MSSSDVAVATAAPPPSRIMAHSNDLTNKNNGAAVISDNGVVSGLSMPSSTSANMTKANSSNGGAANDNQKSGKHHKDSNSNNNENGSEGFKLSKIGRRIRESCRNLRGKRINGSGISADNHKNGSSGSGKRNVDPEEYSTVQATNESARSKHYVAMDFTGRVGRIIKDKDVPRTSMPQGKDGYAYYYKRKVSPQEIEPLLSEVQKTIHLNMPWFHHQLGRDAAHKILAAQAVDGAFLVRDSSVKGGFVISYFFNGRTFHAQAMPDFTCPNLNTAPPKESKKTKAETNSKDTLSNNNTNSESDDEEETEEAKNLKEKLKVKVGYYSLDEGRTRFLDLVQMVEFYQLNRGSLHTRLTHYIVKDETKKEVEAEEGSNLNLQRQKDSESNNTKEDTLSTSPGPQPTLRSYHDSDASMCTDKSRHPSSSMSCGNNVLVSQNSSGMASATAAATANGINNNNEETGRTPFLDQNEEDEESQDQVLEVKGGLSMTIDNAKHQRSPLAAQAAKARQNRRRESGEKLPKSSRMSECEDDTLLPLTTASNLQTPNAKNNKENDIKEDFGCLESSDIELGALILDSNKPGDRRRTISSSDMQPN